MNIEDTANNAKPTKMELPKTEARTGLKVLARGSRSNCRGAREGKGRGKGKFEAVLITRYDSKTNIGATRGSSTAVNKAYTKDTAKRKRDKEESTKKTENQEAAKREGVSTEQVRFPKMESTKTEPVKMESCKMELFKMELPKMELSKRESVKKESAKRLSKTQLLQTGLPEGKKEKGAHTKRL